MRFANSFHVAVALALLCWPAVVRAQFTTVINVPPEEAPTSIGSDTQLNLDDGGVLGNSFSAGAADGTSTNVEVNIDGGTVGGSFRAYSGSTVNISTGRFGSAFKTYDGSMVNIAGGTFGYFFSGLAPNTITLIGDEFELDRVPIAGLENEGDEITLDIPDGMILSGVLADGTPAAFAHYFDEVFDRTIVTLRAAALPPIGAPLIHASTDVVPLGIRNGQTLVVDNGATLEDSFNVGIGARLMVEEGGMVGYNLEAVGAQIEVAGGTILSFNALGASTVDISGGTVDGWITIAKGSTMNVSGDAVLRNVTVDDESSLRVSGDPVLGRVNGGRSSVMEISGGTFVSLSAYSGSVLTTLGGDVGRSTVIDSTANLIDGSIDSVLAWRSDVHLSGASIAGSETGEGWLLLRESTANITGGVIDGYVDLEPDSLLHLFGTSFFIDDVPVAGMFPGDMVTITDRDVTLSGTLIDGSPFSFDLNSVSVSGVDFFSPLATLTVTLFDPVAAADANGDGVVDGIDYQAWASHYDEIPGGDPALAPAHGDFNLDGRVDGLDYVHWARHFGATIATPVPEPGTWGLLLTGAIGWACRRCRWRRRPVVAHDE